MANQLLASLRSQPSSNLATNCATYNGSVFCAGFYLNTLAEAENVNRHIYTKGFDVDQIWIQSQTLLEAIRNSAYQARISEAGDNSEPPKKRARNRQEPEVMGIAEPKHDEGVGFDGDYTEETENLPSKTATSEVGMNRLTTSREDFSASFTVGKPRGGLQNHLDDGFFSIEAFNLETENFERADELGKSFDGLDTTINWHADPDDDVYGSDPDFDQSDSADQAVMYTDFFLPPEHPEGPMDGDTNARQQRIWPPAEDIGSLEGIGGVMDEIQRDLFNEVPGSIESDQESSAPEGIERSSHRNIQARLSDRIRVLEKQNISQREWTLSGETSSKQRPFNSLLQEDLDFERIGKPVPVVTQESTTTLEDIIKGRILTGNFDEILRRNLEHYEKSRRSIVELEDSKSRIGLAEVYEQEHLERATPTQPKSVDAKVNTLRSEISGLFSMVSNQLDMLSSWHFTPKAPQSSLSVVQDIRTLDMEEMQVNSNHLSASMSTTLAPQEVYNPSSKVHQSDGIIKASGIPMSLSEVERSRRAKEKGRKSRGTSDSSKARGSVNENTGILNTLRKADIAVIDRDGKQVSLAGSSRPERTPSSGSRVKL